MEEVLAFLLSSYHALFQLHTARMATIHRRSKGKRPPFFSAILFRSTTPSTISCQVSVWHSFVFVPSYSIFHLCYRQSLPVSPDSKVRATSCLFLTPLFQIWKSLQPKMQFIITETNKMFSCTYSPLPNIQQFSIVWCPLGFKKCTHDCNLLQIPQ